jgi:hypothetical protein
VPNLSRLDQLAHGTHGLLDRRLGVDAVLVVEVDVVDAQPLERRLARLADVVGVAAAAHELAVLAANVAELRRELDLVAPAGNGSGHELLVRERPVHVGRVEERDAEVQRALDRVQSLLLVARSVELGHPHAAEPDGGDLESPSECSPLHSPQTTDARVRA